MPFSAINYPIKAGHEDEISAIFQNFTRVASPDLADEEGNLVGRLLGTAVFINDDVLIRVIHYEGDFAPVGRHMGSHPGVHSLESQLQPYLREERDTGTVEKFSTHFENSLMRCISQFSVDTLPGQG